MSAKFERGMRVAFSGKVTFEYGFKRMNSPYVAFLGEPGQGEARPAQMIAVHPTTEGISTTWMRRFIANALEQTADIEGSVARLSAHASWTRRQRRWRCATYTFQRIAHRCSRRASACLQEVLRLQIEMMRLRRAETLDAAPTVHVPGRRVESLRAQLPFALTDEQESAIADIEADMCAERSMNRMLLGDVGTGKTIVAAFALALSADSGCQAAMMAPTEVLSRASTRAGSTAFRCRGHKLGHPYGCHAPRGARAPARRCGRGKPPGALRHARAHRAKR